MLSSCGAALWLGVAMVAAVSGKLADFEARPPPLNVLMVVMVGGAIVLGLTAPGALMAKGLSFSTLVLLQSFRFPLELVMHHAANEGLMPPQMTFGGEGLNYEIVTGILAVPVGLLLHKGSSRHLAWAFNLLGWATLLGIIGIAVSSTPMFHAFGSDPRHLNTWVAYPPYIWLGAGPVVFALLTHVALTRKLLINVPLRQSEVS